MKKIITALVAITLITSSMPAQANLKNRTSVPTLAILDTALDTSIPSIKSRLIGEVCILDWASCPNGTNFMEGPGSSVLPSNILSTSNFNHGTQMTSVAIQNNANMNILFVRIIGHTSKGMRQNTSINTVPNALKWLYENKDKYNIKAVSMSQGHHNLLKTANYCPVTSTDYWVDWFAKSGIPVFFPSGNGSDHKRIDWPACIPQSIAVGGAENFGSSGYSTALVSNYDASLIDFWAPIQSPVSLPGNVSGNAYGTSVSVQVAAAKWLSVSTLKSSFTISQLLTLIKTTATPITNGKGHVGILINSEKAING